MLPSVTIVILNWNGKKYLEQFMPSVEQTDYPDFEILVVDNGSTDDSISFLKEHYPKVRLLELDKNYGFTTGNNKALPQIKAPYFVLLNNDVEVDKGWLRPMVEMMEADEKIASIQPKLLSYQQRDFFEYAGAAGGYIDVLGYPFTRGRIFETNEKDTGQYDDAKEIFWSTGACMLVRKSVTDQIGLFEDRFFAHMEEIDFCWRAKNFGYKIMYCPEAVAWHLGGGTLPKTNPRKTFLNARNSIAAMILNFPFYQLFYKVFIRFCLDGVWGTKALLKLDFGTIWAIIRAHYSIYFSIFYWLKKRRSNYRMLKKITLPSTGYLGSSIVWKYWVRGKKHFGEL